MATKRCAVKGVEWDEDKKCENEAIWAWQPFGPDDAVEGTFALPGSHYRGWPAVPCCDYHKERIQRGQGGKFRCKGKDFEHLGGGTKVLYSY